MRWLVSASGSLPHALRDRWLGAKQALIELYIVLDSLALKRARSRAAKAAAFLAALAHGVTGPLVRRSARQRPLGQCH